jgi:fumarate hydratase class II
MAVAGSITSTNVVLTLICLPLGLRETVQGFGVNEAASSSDIAITENRIGVDGQKAAGFVPALTEMTVTLQANSPSHTFFSLLATGYLQARDIIPIEGYMELPSLGYKYVMANGTLQNITYIPKVQKVVEEFTYVINWGKYIEFPL